MICSVMSSEEDGLVVGDGPELLAQLSRDHAQIHQYATALVTSPLATLVPQFWRYGDQLIRHEVAEEAVVYPVLLALPLGAEAARALVEEQSALESALVAAEDVAGGSEGARAALDVVIGAARAHQRAEERFVWPLLANGLSVAERRDLGVRYVEVRDTPPELNYLPDARPTEVGRFSALATWLRDSSGAASPGL